MKKPSMDFNALGVNFVNKTSAESQKVAPKGTAANKKGLFWNIAASLRKFVAKKWSGSAKPS